MAEEYQQEVGDPQAPASPEWNTTTKVIILVTLTILIGLSAYFFRIIWVPLIIGSITAYVLYPVVRFIRIRFKIPHVT